MSVTPNISLDRIQTGDIPYAGREDANLLKIDSEIGSLIGQLASALATANQALSAGNTANADIITRGVQIDSEHNADGSHKIINAPQLNLGGVVSQQDGEAALVQIRFANGYVLTSAMAKQAVDSSSTAAQAAADAQAARAAAAVSATTALNNALNADADRIASKEAWTAAIAANPDLNPQVRMNPAVVDVDLAVPSGYNAYAAGPIEVASGVTITVGANASLSII